MHDSCIHYANMLFYIGINSDIKGSKQNKRDISLLKSSDENNTAKLVVDM